MKIGASLDPPPVSIAEFEHLNSEVHEPDPRPHDAHTDPPDTDVTDDSDTAITPDVAEDQADGVTQQGTQGDGSTGAAQLGVESRSCCPGSFGVLSGRSALSFRRRSSSSVSGTPIGIDWSGRLWGGRGSLSSNGVPPPVPGFVALDEDPFCASSDILVFPVETLRSRSLSQGLSCVHDGDVTPTTLKAPPAPSIDQRMRHLSPTTIAPWPLKRRLRTDRVRSRFRTMVLGKTQTVKYTVCRAFVIGGSDNQAN